MKTTVLPFLVVVSGFWLPVCGQEINALLLTQTISLPDVPGGFNHMSSDGERGRLFVTATTKGTLEIIDLHSGKPWRSLAGERPAAALFAPEFNQLYVTRGQKLCIYDGSNFDLLTSVDLQCGLDELQYSPKAKRLFIGCMTSNGTGIAIVGIPDGKPQGMMKLPAKPQGFVVEQGGNRIFANMPSLKQIAVLDREKQTLLASWALEGASGNYPMALDEKNHHLFIGCRHPAQLMVFDTATGKPVTNIAICGDTDDLSYDANSKRIYIACGEGFIDVVEQGDADHYQLREHLSVPPGSRNCCFAPGAGEFYLAVPQRGNRNAEVLIFRSQK